MAESSNDDVIDPNYATETAWLVKVPGELAAMIDTAENDMKIGVFLEEKLEEGAQRRFKKRRYGIEMNETVAKRRQDQLEAEQGKTVQPRPRYGQLNLLPQGQHQMAAFTEKRDAEGDPQVRVTAKIAQQGQVQYSTGDLSAIVTNMERFIGDVDEKLKDRTQAGGLSLADTAFHRVVHHRDREAEKERKYEKKTTAHNVSDIDIKKRLFKRFESCGYYTLRQLHDLERLPMARIRPVLEQIARLVSHETGRKWALKDELRDENDN